ncbi:hypothetical protein CFP56_009664 [Quercus suber]|uniref:Uncharacterized protein n=1 Tax=Quercus suber TaxID=58331 RepID=A0AAW0M5F4_QUESU
MVNKHNLGNACNPQLSFPIWWRSLSSFNITTLAQKLGTNLPANPERALASLSDTKNVAAPQLSVSPYPCLSSTHGNLSLNPSPSSLLKGAAPEPTLLNEDKSDSNPALLVYFTSPSITGGTAGAGIASLDLESRTCLTISDSVLSGLAVVSIAPIENTARHMVGYKSEFVDKTNTTSPFRTPRAWYKPEASERIDLWSCA